MLKTRLEKRQKQDNGHHSSQSTSLSNSQSNSATNQEVRNISEPATESSKSKDTKICHVSVDAIRDPQCLSSSASNASLSSSGSMSTSSPPINHNLSHSNHSNPNQESCVKRLPVSSEIYPSHLLLQKLRSQYRPKLSDIPLYMSDQDVSMICVTLYVSVDNHSISVSLVKIMLTTTEAYILIHSSFFNVYILFFFFFFLVLPGAFVPSQPFSFSLQP